MLGLGKTYRTRDGSRTGPDLSALRKGDQVTVAMTFSGERTKTVSGDLLRMTTPLGAFWFKPEEIVSMTPAPKSIERGCKVKWNTDLLTVIHVENDAAWVTTEKGCNFVAPLADLTRVEG